MVSWSPPWDHQLPGGSFVGVVAGNQGFHSVKNTPETKEKHGFTSGFTNYCDLMPIDWQVRARGCISSHMFCFFSQSRWWKEGTLFLLGEIALASIGSNRYTQRNRKHNSGILHWFFQYSDHMTKYKLWAPVKHIKTGLVHRAQGFTKNRTSPNSIGFLKTRHLKMDG